MRLGQLIAALEAADQSKICRVGFGRPHSYRGDYEQLAFRPMANVSVASMLADARSALGAMYCGYKGGDYVMDEYTECWLSEYGTASGQTLGPTLLAFILEQP